MLDKNNNYTVSPEEKNKFSSGIILDFLLNHKGKIPITLDGDFDLLEDVLIYMLAKDYLEVENNQYFVVTKSGINKYKEYNTNLFEIRDNNKIFSGVDLENGIFAYDKYYDFETDEEFVSYLNSSQFQDLRLVVSEIRKENPLEMIFLELVNESRFDLSSNQWQFELVSGLLWDELVEIANSNLRIEDFSVVDTNFESIEDLINTIILEGNRCYNNLMNKENSNLK